MMRSFPLIALTLSLTACNLDTTGVIPPEATRVDPEPKEAPAIDTTATGFVTTPPRYPIHVHWTRCELAPFPPSCVRGRREDQDPEIEARVVAGINRWAEIIAPSPVAPGLEPGVLQGRGRLWLGGVR